MSETKCNRCNNSFTPSKGLLNYCSMACRNSRDFSTESKKLKSIKQKEYLNSLTDDEQLLYFSRRFGSSTSKFHTTEWHKKLKIHYREKFENTSWDDLSIDLKRRRVLEEQNNKCFACELSEWQGHKLTLEIEHKNGLHHDNSRDNVCALCPNCHSITPTWRGRNKPTRNGDNKVTDDELKQALTDQPSIRQALLYVGMAAKGNNYDRAKKLLDSLTAM